MRHWKLFPFTAVLILLDQLTKAVVVETVRYGERLVVHPRFFDLVQWHNYGAAFGVGHSWPPAARIVFFYLVSSAAILAISYLFFKQDWKKQKLNAFALNLVLAGAIGNLIDRLTRGYVIDFIWLHYHNHYWPAFNLADMAIIFGGGLLTLAALLEVRQK